MPEGICLNLFGFFFTKDASWIDKYVVNHERIHDAQQRELLYIIFYLLYILEWAVRIVQYRNFHKAYMAISFEKEAYAHGDDLSYLKQRKHYAWIKHL